MNKDQSSTKHIFCRMHRTVIFILSLTSLAAATYVNCGAGYHYVVSLRTCVGKSNLVLGVRCHFLNWVLQYWYQRCLCFSNLLVLLLSLSPSITMFHIQQKNIHDAFYLIKLQNVNVNNVCTDGGMVTASGSILRWALDNLSDSVSSNSIFFQF